MTVEWSVIVGLAGILIGSGVTWGIMQHTVSNHERRLSEIETTCEKQRAMCPQNLNALLTPLYEKVNRISEDMAYIRGRWEKGEEDRKGRV